MTRRQRIWITAGTPLLCAAAFFLRVPLMRLAHLLPPCPIYRRTGIYCPGCGNTRGLHALLHFDLPTALHDNITLPFLTLLLLLFYVETAAGLFGKKLHLIPRSGIFWGIVFTAFIAYFIVRNFIPAIAPLP